MPAKRTSAAQRTNVLLEESKLVGVVEAVNSSREHLERKFEARFTAIEERLTNLEFAVRQSSKEVLALREDFDRLRRDFDQRQEAQRLAALERRVEALEKQRIA